MRFCELFSPGLRILPAGIPLSPQPTLLLAPLRKEFVTEFFVSLSQLFVQPFLEGMGKHHCVSPNFSYGEGGPGGRCRYVVRCCEYSIPSLHCTVMAAYLSSDDHGFSRDCHDGEDAEAPVLEAETRLQTDSLESSVLPLSLSISLMTSLLLSPTHLGGYVWSV